MTYELSRIGEDGHRYPYSEKQLRQDFPNTSFPRDLSGVDLTPFGVVAEPATVAVEEKPIRREHQRVPMHAFLYGLREFGVRVQFEAYTLATQGHERDYWLTAPFVTRSSSYVKLVADFFQLKQSDLDAIFTTASSIEE